MFFSSLGQMLRLLAFLMMFCAPLASPVRAATGVDVALVFAVDTSGSVDGHEYALQMNGIAQAITAPDVLKVALSGPQRQIAVCLMTWGDPDEQKFSSPWRIIASAADAEAFAAEVRAGLPRPGGGTGIGQAIAYGVVLLRETSLAPSRSVIDVSGDGRESWELREPRFHLEQAQAIREAAGVTVNGLAILTDVKDLTDYYRANVIGGVGSFAMEAKSYDDFAVAMHKKLLRELLPPIAQK